MAEALRDEGSGGAASGVFLRSTVPRGDPGVTLSCAASRAGDRCWRRGVLGASAAVLLVMAAADGMKGRAAANAFDWAAVAP